jgi:hypothetical protein
MDRLQRFFMALVVMTASTQDGAQARSFKFEASGELDSQNVTINGTTSILCGLACDRKRICTMFSLVLTGTKSQNGEKLYLCRLSFGASSWTPLPNSNTSIFVGMNLREGKTPL